MLSSRCFKCNEMVNSWDKDNCPKCGYDFNCGDHCPNYRNKLYTREDVWEYEGWGCMNSPSFDYLYQGYFSEKISEKKCNTPEYDRNCPYLKG